MSEGSVYAVLYKSGLFKIGYSSNPAQRIVAHISIGRSIGEELDMFFVTDRHFGVKKTEARLLKFCADRFHQNTTEYFEGGDYFSVREVMIASKRLVTWASGLKTIGEKAFILVPITEIQDNKTINNTVKTVSDNLADKIKKVVSNNRGITLGVLKNRLRKISPDLVEDTLCSLIQQGVILCNEYNHANNRMAVKILEINDEFFDNQESMATA